MQCSVLIVDDEGGIRTAFRAALQMEEYEVFEAETGESALSLIQKNDPDVILLDMNLPDMSGLDILRQIKEQGNQAIVIMMTAFGDIELAVQAMQLGAENFRMKPFNVLEMKSCIKKAVENRKNKTLLDSYKNEARQRFGFQQIIGESRVMKHIHELIKKIAKSPSSTVLIQGPSGTGKELVARAIHYNSDRAEHRFIEVNCTAIPESLLESELFGHEKGSFTDAKKEHKGIFEQADGGTLFLDEIGDMPFAMQAKLLRVLQEKRFKRIGGNKDLSVDVRIIASTNVNLEEAVKKGSFREDLYYRLKVVPITLPALKERQTDSLLIARYYLKQFCKEFKKAFKGFTNGAEKIILEYDWPGNIRELKNVMERAILLENGDWIDARHLNLEDNNYYDFNDEIDEIMEENVSNQEESDFEDEALSDSCSPEEVISASFTNQSPLSLTIDSLKLEDVEKALLIKALKEHQWNRNVVSKVVGINRTTLYSKIKKYGLEKELFA